MKVYTLEFNESNLKSLFDKRINDDIDWVVKEEQNGTPVHVAREPNVKDTFRNFLKPFSYLYNAEYITPEMKAQYRQEAIDQGLLSAPTRLLHKQQVPERYLEQGPIPDG